MPRVSLYPIITTINNKVLSQVLFFFTQIKLMIAHGYSRLTLVLACSQFEYWHAKPLETDSASVGGDQYGEGKAAAAIAYGVHEASPLNPCTECRPLHDAVVQYKKTTAGHESSYFKSTR